MARQYALESITDERMARIALSYCMPLGNELTGRLLQDYGAVQTLRYALDISFGRLDTTALAY